MTSPSDPHRIPPRTVVYAPSRLGGAMLVAAGLLVVAAAPATLLLDDPAWAGALMGVPAAFAGVVVAAMGYGYLVSRVELGERGLRLVVPTLRYGGPSPPRRTLEASWDRVTAVTRATRVYRVPFAFPVQVYAVEAAGRRVAWTKATGLPAATVATQIAARAAVPISDADPATPA